MIVQIDSELLEEKTRIRLLADLHRDGGVCTVTLPCSYIHSAQSHVDVAQDFALAAYVGELLNSSCATLRCQRDFDPKAPVFRFSGHVSQKESFVDSLLYVASGIDPDDYGDEDYINFFQEFSDFTDRIWQEEVAFPDLADDYMLNEIVGQAGDNIGDEEDIEAWARFFPQNPEARFHFITSNRSHSLPGKVFSSSRVIVASSLVPIDLVIASAWEESERQPGSNLEATLIASKLESRIYTDGSNVIQANWAAVDEAREMLWACFGVSMPLEHAFSYGANAEYAAIHFGDWNILLFPSDIRVLPSPAVESLLTEFEQSTDLLRSALGRPTSLMCSWECLDDEAFERLCYDIIACQERFDPTSLRKMGKSRSRDGGRDLEVMTKSISPGEGRKKWVVQCKAIDYAKALGGSKVQVSDVLDQFGAQGFAIMTTGLIDATLYDKIVAIAANRGIDYDFWDQLRLERFLGGRREIRERYFGK